MSDEYFESAYAQIRDVIARLQSPIADMDVLLGLLAAPLAAWHILPPRFVKYNTAPLPSQGISVSRHAPPLQRALLEQIMPAWAHMLEENDAFILVQQYFSPDLIASSQTVSKQLAVLAYSTILSLPLPDYSVRLLAHLCRSYPVDVLWSVLVHGGNSSKSITTWQDCVRDVASIPAKVANALGTGGTIPVELEYGAYFNALNRRFQILFESLPSKPSQDELTSVSYLLTKLVNIGVFTSGAPTSPSQASFWASVLPAIRSRVDLSSSKPSAWPVILGSGPSILTLQTIIISLLSHLEHIPDLDGSAGTRALVKREALLLSELFGPLTEESEVFNGLSAAALGRKWTIGHARVLICLAAGCGTGPVNTAGLELLLSKVVVVWTTPDHIRHSLLAGHRYFTAFIVIIISYLTAASGSVVHPALTSLSLSPPFINSITTYITHLDPSVRRCGMLVAEQVARATGKKLDFGDWDGEKDGKPWSRQIRELVKQKDTDADISMLQIDTVHVPGDPEIRTELHDVLPASLPATDAKTRTPNPRVSVVSSGYDSDDSLTGYASEPSSSRSVSPSPSELEEIEKDPTLRVGQKKIARPVYLAQLGEMVRPTNRVKSEDEQDEPKKLQIALDVAEELIRRKRAYGTELEENAVNLAYGFLGLQDNYDLDGFDEKRQAALTALVACCPQKAAQSLAEEFFKNQYSTEQRFALLNALVFGARELAGLPIPSQAMQNLQRISFPSKQLPPALHRKYLRDSDQSRTLMPVQHILDDISRGAISRTRDSAEDKVPELVRERRLRVKQPSKISEVFRPNLSQALQSLQLQPKPVVAYTEVAAENFICPLMNRFWLFLRDEQAREVRTAHQPSLHQYRAAGTGLILNPLVLSQFLGSLAILVHMARNAKEYLAIVAPDALELAVTVGTRPLTQGEGFDDDDESGEGERKGKEAAVLTAALELALIVIDGCLELDDGRSLGLEHTALLLGAGEWAGEVLAFLEKGEKAAGGGGAHEVKLGRAAAGLALKVDELSARWRRSMVSL